MNLEQLKVGLPSKPSESTKRRNPHLWTMTPAANAVVFTPPKPRIRQSKKPLMNKLEQEFFNALNAQYPNYDRPLAQAITFRLANGCKYTPDILAFRWPDLKGPDRTTAWEVKGKWFPDDAKAKLKMFAHEYREIRVVLLWKQDGQWCEQEILP